MYSTTAYLYQQITRVLLIDTSGGYFTARYDPVYAKQLTVNKGVDNVLLFEFTLPNTGTHITFRALTHTDENNIDREVYYDFNYCNIWLVKRENNN